MIDKINILPLVGIEGLHLGSTKEMVLETLGDPDNRSVTEYKEDNSQNEDWIYSKPGLELTFFSDDIGLLGAVSVWSPDSILKGRRMIGIPEENLLKVLKQIGIIPTVLQDEFKEVNAKDYVCDKFGLSFWVHNGKVTTITIIPEYDEQGEEPIWPEQLF